MEMLERFNLSGRVMGQPSNNQTGGGYQQQAPQNGYVQPNGYAPAPLQPAPDPNDYPTWAQLQAFIQQQAQQQFTPQIDRMYENQAAVNLQMLRGQDKYKAVFEDYGPEFHTEVAKLPATARSLDNLQMVADLVRGRHVDELVRKGATQLNTTPPTMRPNGFAGSSGAPPTDNGLSLQSDQIPAAWKQRAIEQGLTDESIAEFCRANNQTTRQFYEMLNKTRVVTDATIMAEQRDTEGKLVGREMTLGR
jgi:DNA primase